MDSRSHEGDDDNAPSAGYSSLAGRIAVLLYITNK